MSDLRSMSREFLTEFIELYREHPCLWRVKSKEYSDRNKKNSAYEKLIQKLKEVDSSATKETVIKKINTMRGCFRKEHKKVVMSLRSGTGEENVYYPHLWYYDLLLFVQDQETPRCSRSNLQDSNESSEVFSDTHEEVSNDMPSPTTESTTLETSSEHSAPSTSSHNVVTPLYPQAKRQKTSTPKVSKTDEILTLIGNHLQHEEVKADEFDAVGNNVSYKLRRLPKEMRIFAEKLINDVMFYAELGKLNENSVVVTNQHHGFSGFSGLAPIPNNAPGLPADGTAANVVEENNVVNYFRNYSTINTYNHN